MVQPVHTRAGRQSVKPKKGFGLASLFEAHPGIYASFVKNNKKLFAYNSFSIIHNDDTKINLKYKQPLKNLFGISNENSTTVMHPLIIYALNAIHHKWKKNGRLCIPTIGTFLQKYLT